MNKIIGLVLLVLAIILAGTFLYMVTERVSFLDGLYFALETALTIGFGDIVGKTRLGRVITLVIGFLGLVLFGILVAKATYALHLTLGDHRLF